MKTRRVHLWRCVASATQRLVVVVVMLVVVVVVMVVLGLPYQWPERAACPWRAARAASGVERDDTGRPPTSTG